MSHTTDTPPLSADDVHRLALDHEAARPWGYKDRAAILAVLRDSAMRDAARRKVERLPLDRLSDADVEVLYAAHDAVMCDEARTLDGKRAIVEPLYRAASNIRAARRLATLDASTPVSGTLDVGRLAAAMEASPYRFGWGQNTVPGVLTAAKHIAREYAALSPSDTPEEERPTVDAPRPEPRRCIWQPCAATWPHFHGWFPGGYTNPDDPDGQPIAFVSGPQTDWQDAVRDYNGREVKP